MLSNLATMSKKPHYESALPGDYYGYTDTVHRLVGRCHVVTSSALGGECAIL